MAHNQNMSNSKKVNFNGSIAIVNPGPMMNNDSSSLRGAVPPSVMKQGQSTATILTNRSRNQTVLRPFDQVGS